jgi:hypothetical protein
MNMRSIYLCVTAVLLSLAAHAQTTLPASPDVKSVRPIGSERFWTFTMFDSTIGALESKVVGEGEVDGHRALIFQSRLRLNYRVHQSKLLYDITSHRWVSESGAFLGDSMHLVINDANERLLLKRSGEKLSGYATRGGNEVPVNIDFPYGGMAIDDNFYDQYELLLALRDLHLGDSLIDTVFSPQSMLPVVLRGSVESKIQLNLGDSGMDSVFVVYLVEPQAQLIYFTRDKRIALVEIPQQNMRVLQAGMPRMADSNRVDRKPVVVNKTIRVPAEGGEGDVPPAAQTPQGQQPSTTPSATNQPPPGMPPRPDVPVTALLIQYLTFVLVGLIALSLFLGRGYRWGATYIAGLLGLAAFALMPISANPLQMYLIKSFFAPQVQTGGSPFLWAFIPAAGVALVQELIKGLVIFAVIYRGGLKEHQFTVIGAAVGAVFGIAEACYVVTQFASPELFSAVLLERIFILVYHVGAGAILGAALRFDLEVGIYTVIGLIIANSLFRYMPVFAQTQVLSIEPLSLIMAFLSVAVLTTALIMVKKSPDKSRLRQRIQHDAADESAS